MEPKDAVMPNVRNCGSQFRFFTWEKMKFGTKWYVFNLRDIPTLLFKVVGVDNAI